MRREDYSGRHTCALPHHLPQAFGEQAEIYMQRIEALKQALLHGRLHKAKQLCLLDFEPG